MNNLAGVLCSQGKYKAAEEIQRQTLQLMEKALGLEHPTTLTSMDNLALMLSDQGKYEAAEEMHQRALELMEKVLGPTHRTTLLGVISRRYLVIRANTRRLRRCRGRRWS